MTTETFKLSRPLKTHSGQVTELTLREPDGSPFMTYGEPYTLVDRHDAEGNLLGTVFTFTKDNNKAMFGFLSKMTGIDDLLLSAISASDYQKLRLKAAHLLAMGAGTSDPIEPSSAQ